MLQQSRIIHGWKRLGTLLEAAQVLRGFDRRARRWTVRRGEANQLAMMPTQHRPGRFLIQLVNTDPYAPAAVL